MTWVLLARLTPALLVTLLAALMSRAAAHTTGQPRVVGEIAAGLALGPLLVLATGRVGRTAIFPSQVVALLHDLGQVGLVLLVTEVAYGLRTTVGCGQLRSVSWVVVGSSVHAWLVRCALSWGPTSRSATRLPRVTCVGVAALALGAAVTEQVGLTAVFGAVLVGLALQDGIASPAWPAAAHTGSRVTSWLVSVFFVASGVTTFTAPVSAELGAITPVVVLLAALSKIGGGYLGARLGGHPTTVGWRIGVLVNTRGLTELIALQAGYSSGILSSALYFACLVMALVTTGLTGALLSLLDRRGPRDGLTDTTTLAAGGGS
jgi:Kef-type K+ transport system membrane component KefB